MTYGRKEPGVVTAPIEEIIAQAIIPTAIARIRRNYAAFAGQFPSYGDGHLAYHITPNNNWLASFWAGLLWLVYMHTKNMEDCERAKSLLPSFQARLDDSVRLNHDLGFLFTLSARAQWQMLHDDAARQLAVRSAEALFRRYRSTGRYIQAWDGAPEEEGRFIIDGMMNLSLLFWAARETGNERYRNAALNHAHTSLRHLVRDDGSTYHTFYLHSTTGDPIGPRTHQGYGNDSLWARGQGWAVYGFTLAAEWSGDAAFAEAAVKAAQRYQAEAPITEITPYDLRLPPHAPRYPDSSADAIVAGGLLRLAKLTGDDRYRQNAIALLDMLWHKAFDRRVEAQGLLLHGTQHAPHGYGIDTYTIFGDYFFLEAVMNLTGTAPDFWGPNAP